MRRGSDARMMYLQSTICRGKIQTIFNLEREPPQVHLPTDTENSKGNPSEFGTEANIDNNWQILMPMWLAEIAKGC